MADLTFSTTLLGQFLEDMEAYAEVNLTKAHTEILLQPCSNAKNSNAQCLVSFPFILLMILNCLVNIISVLHKGLCILKIV